MVDVIHTRAFEEPPFVLSEALRYAGAGKADAPEISALAQECYEQIRGRLAYRVCWRAFPLSFGEGALDLGFMRTASAALRRNLEGCGSIVLFAATTGIEMDRAIARAQASSATRALMLQAVGAERIESLCDAFCAYLAQMEALKERTLRPRFSPGYGDFPLEAQRDVFRALDCPRKIGLTLNESLLMSPTKSVTAIAGIAESCAPTDTDRCAACAKAECEFRRV